MRTSNIMVRNAAAESDTEGQKNFSTDVQASWRSMQKLFMCTYFCTLNFCNAKFVSEIQAMRTARILETARSDTMGTGSPYDVVLNAICILIISKTYIAQQAYELAARFSRDAVGLIEHSSKSRGNYAKLQVGTRFLSAIQKGFVKHPHFLRWLWHVFLQRHNNFNVKEPRC